MQPINGIRGERCRVCGAMIYGDFDEMARHLAIHLAEDRQRRTEWLDDAWSKYRQIKRAYKQKHRN